MTNDLSKRKTGKSEALVAYLRNQILNGDLDYSKPLPSFFELEVQFNVSRATIEKSLIRLTELGLIRREQGRGVYALAPEERQGPIDICCGLYARDLVNSGFFWKIFGGITAGALINNRDTRLLSSLVNLPPAAMAEKLPVLLTNRAALGLIAFGMYTDDLFLVLRDMGYPTVSLDFDTAHLGLDCVVMDNSTDAQMLTNMLLRDGHKKIAHVHRERREDGTFKDPDMERRRDGIIQALRVAGIEEPEKYAIEYGPEALQAVEALEATALICEPVPELKDWFGTYDLALFNSSETVIRELPESAITTNYDLSSMGSKGIDVLFQRLTAGRGRAIREIIPPRIARGPREHLKIQGETL